MNEANPPVSLPPVSVEALKAGGDRHRVAPVAVSEWAIRAWCAAIGDLNPRYMNATRAGGISAPPPMLQSWVGPGLMVEYEHGASLHAEVREAFQEAGFPAVVATDYEQEYLREVRPGDRLHETSKIDSISSLKKTKLGAGHFVTIAFEFFNQHDEMVGRLHVRTFYFVPEKKPGVEFAAAPAADNRSSAFTIPITTTLVIAGAMASNDFERVHHDRDLARRQGFSDIILSIITTAGLVSRAASRLLPSTTLRSLSLRLGSPAYPGDELSFRCKPAASGDGRFEITGDTQRGRHVSAIVAVS